MKTTFARCAALLGLAACCAALPLRASAAELNLALANSTCDVMRKVGDLFRLSQPVTFSYQCKSSGLLAKGLRGGALQADVFVSADQTWMDYMIEAGLVDRDRVVSAWGNVMVVAAPRAGGLQRLALEDLASDRVHTILIGDPSNAPVGRHAKEALEAAGLWDAVKGKIQTRKHMQLLVDSLAEGGEGTVGFLFLSNLNNQLNVVHTVRKSLHGPIRYYVAPLKAAQDRPEVAAFVKFLQSRAASNVFQAARFDVTP